MVGTNLPVERVLWRRARRSIVLPDAVRISGWSIFVGGVLVVVASLLAALLLSGTVPRVAPGYEMFEEQYRLRRLTNMACVLPGAVGMMLVSAGFFGTTNLSPTRTLSTRLIRLGVFIAFAFALAATTMTVYEFMPRYAPPFPLEITPLQVYQAVAATGCALGVTVAGVAVLKERSLGAARMLPLFLGLAGIPPERLFVFLDFPAGPVFMADVSVAQTLWIEAVRAASGIGWILFGIAALGARRRGHELQTAESREVARRFYERFWVSGDVSVADELLSADFDDLRHHRSGPEAFKHVLTDLRSTFPDMRFEVLSQTADGCEVQTEWRISGFDTGGLLYFPPTGRRVAFTGTFTDTVRAGKIVEHSGYTDEAALFRQLGLAPSR